jgi:hypothetical protein
VDKNAARLGWLFRLRPFMAYFGSKSSMELTELGVLYQAMEPAGARLLS